MELDARFAGQGAREAVAYGPLAGWGLLATAALFASWAVFRQLGGYDLSPLVDLFWRMRGGEIPGVDFINTFPPLVLILAKVFAGFDLGWYEITVANIAVAAATFAALVSLTPRAERSVSSCLAQSMAVAIPLAYTNHLWPSSLSQYCAAVFFVALFRAMGESAWDRRAAFSLFASSVVLALVKQNVALPVIAVSLAFVMLLGGERRWAAAGAIAGGAVAGLAGAMLLLRISPATMIEIYTAVAGRARPSDEMILALRADSANRVALSLCLAAIVVAAPFVRRLPSRQRVLALLFLGLSLVPMVTDWDSKLNNVTLPLIVAATVAVLPAPGSAGRLRAVAVQALIASLLILAIFGGAIRDRMRAVGPGLFWEGEADHRIEEGYFRGLHTGRNLVGALDGMARLQAARPGARLFFGPRIEFGYAVLRVPSPRGMPLWWHPGSSYALRDEARVIGPSLPIVSTCSSSSAGTGRGCLPPCSAISANTIGPSKGTDRWRCSSGWTSAGAGAGC